MRPLRDLRLGIRLAREEGVTALLNRAYSFYGFGERRTNIVHRIGQYRARARYRIQRQRFAAPAHPEKTIWIDPEVVNSVTYHPSIEKGLAQIQSGAWDEGVERLDEQWIYKGLAQRLRDGADWQDTEYYTIGVEAFCTKMPIKGYDSSTAFKRKQCAYLDQLFKRLSQTGYNERNRHAIARAKNSNLKYESYIHPTDVLVAIGRDGDVVLASGMHLFSIARLAGLDEIPVKVVLRHGRWQLTRDRVYLSDSGATRDQHIASLHDHPDMKDIANDRKEAEITGSQL